MRRFISLSNYRVGSRWNPAAVSRVQAKLQQETSSCCAGLRVPKASGSFGRGSCEGSLSLSVGPVGPPVLTIQD